MSQMFIHADVSSQQLLVDAPYALKCFQCSDAEGRNVELPMLSEQSLADGQVRYRFDASRLQPWTPERPTLYYLSVEGEARQRFGMVELKPLGNKTVLVNGKPYFFRGYIRGIVAHDHPNLSGKSLYESYLYHIRQAKKYGFNLVRFHSTIPKPEFIRAADELGLFIHMEIGFSYSYDSQGNKQGLTLDNKVWKKALLDYRNNPSTAIFCIGNEMHQAGHVPAVHKLYAEGKALAPNKLIMDNSGWGEFDRSSADIFSQHIAYFYPFKRHREMFMADDCWRINGSMYDSPLETQFEQHGIKAQARRHANPLRPVLAHEAVHYIEIPDYEKLNRKFDDFAQRVGEQYLQENKIKKPRFMTELPALIRQKNLKDKIKDYQLASQKLKKLALKNYLERLRLSELVGFEMLQFADCFKYENKNGIVDCFDDDKFIDSNWFRQFNEADVLLIDQEKECVFNGETIVVPLYLSHFSEKPNLMGDLTLTVTDGSSETEVYRGEHIVTVPGVQKVLDLTLSLPASDTAVCWRLLADFRTPDGSCHNDWEFRTLPQPCVNRKFVSRLSEQNTSDWLAQSTIPEAMQSDVVVTDRLNEQLFSDLEAGRTVVLFYHRDNPGQEGFYLPGALDRFKPCIWDRGSNLGGIVNADFIRRDLASDHYFGAEYQPLCEEGYKLNLDHFPGKIHELIAGVDKPVRDRMKGLIHQIKDFQPDDTLRNFCYLGAMKIGKGRLLISTFSMKEVRQPAVGNYVASVLNHLDEIDFPDGPSLEKFHSYATTSPVIREDVMNHFWEMDNKPVEDTLFWEEAGLDLSSLKD